MTTQTTTTIVYPETDGMPLPDGEYQAPLYVRIVGILRTFFRNIKGARVNGDTFIYYVQGDPAPLLLAGLLCCARTDGRGNSVDRAKQHLLAMGGGQAARLHIGDGARPARGMSIPAASATCTLRLA